MARLAAATVAVNWVADTNFVVSAVPLKWISEPDMKSPPVTLIGVSGEPAASTEGLIAVTCGAGLSTVKLTEFDAPPPGDGFVTTTANDPAVAWSLALSEMVS